MVIHDGGSTQKVAPIAKEKFILPQAQIESLAVGNAVNGPAPKDAAFVAGTAKPLVGQTPKMSIGGDTEVLTVREVVQHNLLETAQPLDPLSFPNPPRKPGGQVTATYANVQHLLRSYSVEAGYDAIKKKVRITIPYYAGSPDNFDNVALTLIVSLASLNGMATGQVPRLVEVVADKNQYNPVASWILSKPWDGVDRLPAYYATLEERADFPKALKETLMYRWGLSATAAALMVTGFHSRGVLTLLGDQELGKSAWGKALVSDPVLSADVVLENHHLDPSNKDTLIAAARHWIVEFAEVEGMLNRDLARLKGFITSGHDKIRVPYARAESEFQRRTVFFATVNLSNFLTDTTGNTRFWTVPVTKVNYKHGIDMQQVFAQFAVAFNSGEQWWLTQAESAALEEQNKQYRVISALRERLIEALDMTCAKVMNLPAMTPTQVLQAIGMNNPTNTQAKECADTLRELLGESKRINGSQKWRVPLRYRHTASPALAVDDDEY